MKIGIVAGGIPPEYIGGAEVQSYRLAEKLSIRHNVTLFVKSKRNAGFCRGKLNIVKCKFLNIKKINIFSAAFSLYRKIKKDKNRIDVLICFQTAPAGIAGFMAKKFLNIPYIQMIRSMNDFKGNNTLGSRFLVKKVFDNSSILIAQTESIKTNVKKLFPEKKVIVIGNGIIIPKKKASGKCIIFVGSLLKVKGVTYLISALKMINNPPQTLIIGEGPMRGSLEKQTEHLDVKFIGRIVPEKIVGYLQRGELFVLPSLSEGFPNVILEAMSVGLPVVATKVGGIPNIVEQGRTGFLVEPYNPGQLAFYIKKLLRDKKLRKTMSKNCLKEVKKYSWKKIIPKLERILEDAVK
jgi:glycosyltransferase involved in cell wall biosynthesis